MVLLNLRNLWTPANAANLIAWYDASDADTITESGGNVSQWRDKSGNARHLNQDTASNQPEWGLGPQINGMNVIDYDGTFDQMFVDGLSDIDCTQLSHIALIQPQPEGDFASCGALLNTAVTDKLDHRIFSNTTDGNIRTAFTLDGTVHGFNSASDNSLAEGTSLLSAFWYDGADAVSRTNGGVVSQTIDVADAATFTINRIQVGRESNTPRNWQGELVILQTANINEIEKAEGYLAWRWGTVANLAAGHPYKSAPPSAI